MADGLRLDTLEIRLGGRCMVALDAHVAPGEVLTVMGPSGSGKSTLLAAITGALDPAFALSGRILLDGEDVTALPTERRSIGILFQDELLFPHLSVGGNLAFGLTPSLRGRAARRKRIDSALQEIGLEGFAARDPATLSGGQKARVALMRTLLAEPRALLLDEPFSRLDAARRGQIRELVFARAKAQRLPVLLVTHDREDACAAGGAVIELGA
ncbi:ATP-binding cassette domain-containing protein [Salipiger bermudensis]|uniref:ATP-binding cassette domain-containing protein n=1 Tax=Salipiger bermudensis TaxID=344736 RepID=UPI001A905088|nr:ATP-binding cassette domain-containing protein [Salipiger bermudensis]MBN9678264.1 ATP-binding cassette domain-containing protein [Salipiger bermudensis]